MNFILLLHPPTKYNSAQQQLSEFNSHVSKLPLRRSLQSEGGTRNRQIKCVGENTIETPTFSNLIHDCKDYAI